MMPAKVKYFKDRQIRLAERLMEELGGSSYTIVYEQNFKQCKEDREMGIYDVDGGEIIFPEFLTPSRKSRIIVHISVDADHNRNAINRVMARWHMAFQNGNGGCKITYSVNLNSIGSCTFMN